MSQHTHNRHDWREVRRLRAWELYQQGWSQTRIAQELGVTQSAVSRWFKQARDAGGTAGLIRHPAPGKASRLTEEQRLQISALIARGAQAFGFQGNQWTTKRAAIAFQQVFGITYHPGHISKLLKKYSPDWRTQPTASNTPQRDSRSSKVQQESDDT